MWSTYEVYEPCHMQWMGIWNHRQPVTIALVDPDFDSRLIFGSLLGYKPYRYAVVEAPYPSKAACTLMWSTYKVVEPLQGNPLPSPLLTQIFQSAESLAHTAGLQTIPLCSG